MTTVDLNPNDVCHCGDYRSSHPGGVGPCGLCSRSRAPYDVCSGFVFHYHDAERGEPVTRRRGAQTPPRDQGAMSDG